ncbi:MAG: hypothetical protein EB060_01050 [Proteobacteria bacterium]|nr:hypothetical protein [Pseudomonadota bacterium]
MKKILISLIAVTALASAAPVEAATASKKAAAKPAARQASAVCEALGKNIAYMSKELTNKKAGYDKATVTNLKQTLDTAYVSYYKNDCKEELLTKQLKGTTIKPRSKAEVFKKVSEENQAFIKKQAQHKKSNKN